MNNLAWIYLFIASLSEIFWIYSLKYLQFKKLWDTGFINLLTKKSSFILLLPVMGYVVFGLCNVYFLSRAMKNIPPSVAYAAWTAIAIVGIKVMDVIVLKQHFSIPQILFTLVILAGIVGLKIYS